MKKAIILFPILFYCFRSQTFSQGIYIEPGARIVVSQRAALNIKNGGINNSGTFVAGTGSVIFSGSAGITNSFISGSPTSFYNLFLNKTSGGIRLETDISITDSLYFISGDSLFLNNHIIDLGSTGALHEETENSRITGRSSGYIQSTAILNAPSSANPGNLGIYISSNANLGSTVIRRGHVKQGGGWAFRYFDIIPTNNSGLNANIAIHYLPSELENLLEENLAVFSSADGGTNWAKLGADSINTSGDLVYRGLLNSLNRLTLGPVNDPLGLKLLFFKATTKDGKVLLHWQTTEENNFSHFQLERAEGREVFQNLAIIPRYLITSVINNYAFTDSTAAIGDCYYRLKIIDQDGSFTYSPVLKIQRQTGDNLRVFPVPAVNRLFLEFESASNSRAVVSVTDLTGSTKIQLLIPVSKGWNRQQLDISGLSPGVYGIFVTIADKRQQLKFIKAGN